MIAMPKIGEPKAKYDFVDISVMMRKEDGTYLNLTDFNFNVSAENPLSLSGIKSAFALVFCTFARRREQLIGCEVSLEELLALAGIKGKRLVSQLRSGTEPEFANQMIAVVCAKKIVDYAYGKCLRLEGESLTYEFHRQTFENGKRVYPIVLTKAFIRIGENT
ncbi:hypothetical protein DWX94_13775 [Coprococcus eutactus]|uniref:Uncharacterized protein n=1 Tax=Coprococcus eutactus TaxID=33043 RepID=A0A412IES8_9FIRM|nr:hypothetical protein DWX94_13775 [Coprococcus eutactus]